jgi:DUF4097 and DUF4098 domain-containing protein YvlB
MKRIKILSLIIMTAVLFTGVVRPASVEQQQKTRKFSVNKNGKLIVNVNPGTVKIKTTSKDEVIVNVKNLDEDLLKSVEISADKNTVEVRYEEGADDPEFYITVPVKFNLELKTSAGDIQIIDRIDGDVNATTSGGDINTEEINGNLTAESSGGNISLQGKIGGTLKVNTMGGDLAIAQVYGKNSKITTAGGEISILTAANGITAKTYGGDITAGDLGGDSDFITYGGNITVAKTAGNLKMETYGGNLELTKATGKVRGKTNGGNIELQDVTGSVDVKTLSGEISVGLKPEAGSESVITTNAGSIELRISKNAKVTIIAKIHVQGWWRNAKDNFSIQSDFESTTYNLDEDSHDIIGVYVLNGGGSKINLRSVNDEIRIVNSNK